MCSWLPYIDTAMGVVTALTAVFGVFVALPIWQQHKVDDSHVRLAEDVLAMFYEAKDKLDWVRVPAAFSGEGKSRVRAPNETESLAATKDAYFVPLERISKDSEFWSRLSSLRIRFRVIFGDAAAEPFNRIVNVHRDIAIGARMLITTARTDGSAPTDPEAYAKWKANQDKWEAAIGWGDPDNDDTAREIDKAVKEMEDFVRPIIQRKVKPAR